MKVWITKYALTQGVFEKEMTQAVENPSMIHDTKCVQFFFGEGKEWHKTEEGANARAEQMRLDKIASLKKQLAKLEKLKFT